MNKLIATLVAGLVSFGAFAQTAAPAAASASAAKPEAQKAGSEKAQAKAEAKKDAKMSHDGKSHADGKKAVASDTAKK